jgi:vitamin B12 transporter
LKKAATLLIALAGLQALQGSPLRALALLGAPSWALAVPGSPAGAWPGIPAGTAAQAQLGAWIEGRIFDKDTKDPLPAYVLAEDGRGCSADGQGRFRLAVAGKTGATVKLSVFLIGYKKKEVTARIGEPLTISLDLEPLPAREILVTADSGLTDAKNARTVKLDKMDVYSLPGTAADPILATQVLPGVNALPDTSSLLIRGGAPDEVAYVFDGIEIPHPFLSESLHESYFSIFDNQVIQSFSVATSGFSPRYGNALSGIMDLTAKDSPAKGEGGIGLSIMGLNSYIGVPVEGWGSFVGSYNRSFSDLLTELNGRHGNRFGSGNAFGKFNIRLGTAHQIRIYGMSDSYKFYQSGAFGLGSGNLMTAATWTASWSERFATKATAAWTRYDVDYREATLDARTRDDALQSRVDAMWDLDRHYLEFGADVMGRRLDTSVALDPVVADDAGGGGGGAAGAPGAEYSNRVRATRFGFYVNDKFRLTDKIFLNAGGRAAALDVRARSWAFDPRLSIVYLAGKSDAVRFSTGIYHQFGDAATLQVFPALGPKSAVHFALSFDRIRDDLELRATAYDKEYRDLFLTGADGAVTNGGKGYARGAEVFLKKKFKSFEVLGVYNFLHSRRMEDDVRFLAPSPYDVSHSATGIVRWIFKRGSLGVRYSYASGRPYTPLEGIIYTGPDGAEPASGTPSAMTVSDGATLLWGDPFSARYPAYKRMDINGMANLKAFGRMLVLYFGVTNVFNDNNILRYDYAPDTGARADQQSIFGRTLFVGAYVPFF